MPSSSQVKQQDLRIIERQLEMGNELCLTGLTEVLRKLLSQECYTEATCQRKPVLMIPKSDSWHN